MTFMENRLKKLNLRRAKLRRDGEYYKNMENLAINYSAHHYQVLPETVYEAFLERARALATSQDITDEAKRLWDLGVAWGWYSVPGSMPKDIADDRASALFMAKVRHLLRRERPLLEFVLMQEEEEETFAASCIDMRENSLLQELYLEVSPNLDFKNMDGDLDLCYHPFGYPKSDQLIVEEILERLGAAQIAIGGDSKTDGDIFTRGPDLVKVTDNSITSLKADSLAEILETIAIRECEIKTTVPIRIVGNILRRRSYPGFRSLNTVVRHPFFDTKGRIFQRSGYNRDYQVYITGKESYSYGKDPEDAANHVLEEVLYMGGEEDGKKFLGWPFVSEADQAAAFALALTPFLRPAIETAPAVLLLRQSNAGTGTSLLAETLMRISLGSDAGSYIVTMPDEELELEKLLFSTSKGGDPLLFFDNVRRRLVSKALESYMTAGQKRQRTFFTQSMDQYPNRATVIIAGNKGDISAATDMKRRVYPCIMDAKVEEPWLRAGNFKHDAAKGDAIEAWVLTHQTELIEDILSMANGWHEAGNPDVYKGVLLGKFEAWSHTIGNVLAYAGVKGFLGNLPAFYQDADPEGFAAAAMYDYWHDTKGDARMVSKELYDMFNAVKDNVPLPTAVLKALEKDNANALGMVLKNRVGNIVNGLTIQTEPSKAQRNVAAYWIEPISA